MITLVTGTPGAGKSAYALSLMLRLIKEGRPLYVHGVLDLNIPHFAVSCESATCDVCRELDWSILYRMPSADKWHEWAPDGAVLWFEEVQHIHRARSAGSTVPAAVASYETHRHKGLDFFLVTQHPRLIDSNVRQLVGRHVHLVSSWKGRSQYEWPECSDNPQSTTDAIKSSYTLPKHVFPLYKSATIHMKPIRKLPPQVYALIACVILALFVVTRLYFRFTDSSQANKEAVTAPAPDVSKTSEPVVSLVDDNYAGAKQRPTSADNQARFDYNPKVANIPESAPAFAELAKPVTYPHLSGCVVDKREPDGCRCYTQQATPYIVSGDQCRAYIKYGRFDPYRADTHAHSVAGGGGGGAVRAPDATSWPDASPLRIAAGIP